MGSIVSFQPRRAASRRKPAGAAATGSIIIFPGVRYERPVAAAGGLPAARQALTGPMAGKPAPR